MLLRDDITLSKKHQNNFRVFPYFFRPALNHFYFLKDEYGYLKPKLDTWKNEGVVEFTSKDIRILIEYDSPNWVGVCFFKKNNFPTRIYDRMLFDVLGIAFEKDLVKIIQTKHHQEISNEIQEMEKAIEKPIKYLSEIIKDNYGKIYQYLINIPDPS